MDPKEIRKRLKYLPKNRLELLEELLKKADSGDTNSLALAYLICELCPEDRTTKHVVRSINEKLKMGG